MQYGAAKKVPLSECNGFRSTVLRFLSGGNHGEAATGFNYVYGAPVPEQPNFHILLVSVFHTSRLLVVAS
jgi:hypothetical protein